MSRGRIRRYVDRAIESLPEEFRRAAVNVTVIVEASPQPDDLAGPRDDSRTPLMGIYRGIPLTERSEYHMVTPDVIVIFRKPLLRVCRTRKQLFDEVRLTVLHEFGHYMGLPEPAVEHL
jgi:predicted Zn-dependent protease with MMP-like domain